MKSDSMEPLPEHTNMEHCPAFRRDAEEFGDVTLSVQASWGHYCKLGEALIPADHAQRWDRGRLGCAHIPLEHYESVEIALWWTEGQVEKKWPALDFGDHKLPPRTWLANRWITKPSEDLGLVGFDDIWSGDDVAGWVPLKRVGELQVALMSRAAALKKELVRSNG